ncbi:hydroxyacylglutathione hydrolase [Pseudoduganella flava]|uniref:Hydroxyacylglutathione hydrolase n=1 Tax=Pseudoduganella flava TaxID=871742 RepID=A0A562PHV4_9BURK|nr:hydroxyacylglutathione hydrolase [Pseudoduganella flava]QGZ37617.1 hydroxyacylglutathione hydrolase [Pseudoduganella flava]TWI44021.1 hydroxyacylglutathione hydrolase [Pseudoduganella flava]
MNDTLDVLAVPAFNDNYLWLVHDGHHAAVVDPGDAQPVLAALQAHGLTLTAILLTHHHGDHIGGVPELLQHYPVPVFGPRSDGIEAVTQPLGDGDTITVPGIGMRLTVLDVPGHTKGHIAYFRNVGPPWLFCGDTLFAGGCGRLFEGTPAQMAASLDKLAALPPGTKVFCAHEYTLSNLRFALAVEPENDALHARMADEAAKRERGVPTVPSTIALERATNPFLRYREQRIARSLHDAGKLDAGAPPVAVFAALREWKNHF